MSLPPFWVCFESRRSNRSAKQRYAETNQFPGALLTSAEVATLFSPASTSSTSLGRGFHTPKELGLGSSTSLVFYSHMLSDAFGVFAGP
jgi:hypothetical protein